MATINIIPPEQKLLVISQSSQDNDIPIITTNLVISDNYTNKIYINYIEKGIPGSQGPIGPAISSWKDIDSPQDGIIYGRKNGEWTNANNAAKSILSVSNFSGPTLSISTNPPPNIVRLSSATATDLGGISAPNDCYELLIINTGSYAISIKYEFSTESTSTRIITPQVGFNYSLAAGSSVRMIYDTVTQRWRIT
jgi:hypothetical protein